MVKKLEDNKEVRLCKGVTLKGLPCKNKISLKYSYCFFHAGQFYHNEVTTKNCQGFTKLGLPCKKTIGVHIKSDYCIFHKKKRESSSKPDEKEEIQPKSSKKKDVGFSITKGKAFLEASGVSKALKKNVKSKKSDEDDDIFIYPQKRDYKPGDTTDEDIFEFVRKYKKDNPPKKDPEG